MTPAQTSSTRSIRVADVARAIGALDVAGDANVAISGVRQDSRRVAAGDLFVARGGARTTGWNYVEDAIARGAAAVMVEGELPRASLSVPVIVVADVRASLARAAHFVAGDPTQSLDVVGITGTNGKTTMTFLVCAALEACGARPGIMGTLAYRFEDFVAESNYTTPEADEIARIAETMLKRGASHLVMEISSHALEQKRADGVHVRVAAFTNLTQDHLDFHGSMVAYGAAKERLFTAFSPAVSVVNVDDAFGLGLADRVAKRGAKVVRVSASVGTAADIVPLDVDLGRQGIRARVRTPRGDVTLESNLVGAHNLSNLLVATGIALGLDLDLSHVMTAFRDVAVPGRLERCDAPGDDIVVAVDYAHTPDALERVLGALDPLRHGAPATNAPVEGLVVGAQATTQQSRGTEGASPRGATEMNAPVPGLEPGTRRLTGRLVCVFGCGGDRDPKKREPMGRAVAKWADVAVVTTDNARSEDPAAIAKGILPGLAGAPKVVVELDRARAIALAIAEARAGDVVLIAGKGHETYQIVGDVTRHFDDREEARRALAERRQQSGVGA